jgi:hypothetical protein
VAAGRGTQFEIADQFAGQILQRRTARRALRRALCRKPMKINNDSLAQILLNISAQYLRE